MKKIQGLSQYTLSKELSTVRTGTRIYLPKLNHVLIILHQNHQYIHGKSWRSFYGSK